MENTKINVAVNTSLWDSILNASPMVKLVLLILISLSVLCWALAISKRRQLKQMTEGNVPFEARFWKAASLDAIFSELKEHPHSSLARVFRAGYQELQKIAGSALAQKSSADGVPQFVGIDNLERALRKAVDHEIGHMEYRLSLLATTGSTGPFIGLFGTVWGIMGAFHQIGQTGSANLAVVAPGISEALVTTAVGLAAAIPAVVCYNYFVSEIRRQESDLNNFSSDFLNLTKRNFF